MGEQEHIDVVANWRSHHELEVPKGMTKEEAEDAFNDGKFDKFDDFDSSNAELVDWSAE